MPSSFSDEGYQSGVSHNCSGEEVIGLHADVRGFDSEVTRSEAESMPPFVKLTSQHATLNRSSLHSTSTAASSDIAKPTLQHARHLPDEQEGARQGDRGAGGCGQPGPPEDGATSAAPVASRRARHHLLDSGGPDGLPETNDRDEPRRPKEVRFDSVHGNEPAPQPEDQRHPGAVAEDGVAQDLRHGQQPRDRPRRLRTVQHPVVCRDPKCTSRVCQVGVQDRGRGTVQPSAEASGHMAPEVGAVYYNIGDDEGSQGEDHQAKSQEHGRALGSSSSIGGFRVQRCGELTDDATTRGSSPESPEGSPGPESREARDSGSQGDPHRRGDDPRHLRGQLCGPLRTEREEVSEAGISDGTIASESKREPSPELNQSLSEASARHLENQAWSIVPELFQSLSGHDRLALLEIGCESESPLTTAVQQLSGTTTSAARCSIWNGCDLGEPSGLRLVMQRIEVERPQAVWLNPPSSSYSPLQSMNRRTGEQQEALNQKRLAARRAYVGCSVLFHFCVQQGIHVVWAMSDACLAWRLPLLTKLQAKYELYDVICKGCAVNFRDSPGGSFIRNGWRLLTTHARLAQALDLPCRCPKSYMHSRLPNCSSRQGETYTKEFVKRAAKYILQELSHQAVFQEVAGRTGLPEAFGVGEACVCSELCIPNLPPQKCSCCLREGGLTWEPEALGRDSLETQAESLKDSEPLPEAPSQARPESQSEAPWNPEALQAQALEDPAEVLAQQLYVKKDYSHAACEQLLQTMDLHRPFLKTRALVQGPRAQYGTFGLYSYGSQHHETYQLAAGGDAMHESVSQTRVRKQSALDVLHG